MLDATRRMLGASLAFHKRTWGRWQFTGQERHGCRNCRPLSECSAHYLMATCGAQDVADPGGVEDRKGVALKTGFWPELKRNWPVAANSWRSGPHCLGIDCWRLSSSIWL